MCFADRIAFVWAALVGFFLILVGHDDPDFIHNEVTLFLLAVAPVWGFFKLLEWVFRPMKH